MATEYRWPVTNYRVILMSRGFGWIRLLDGEQDAGYIYFEQDPEKKNDRIGAQNSGHPYVVMHQPIANWLVVLDLLRHEAPLYIRGHVTDEGEVSGFFGTSTAEPVGEAEV